MKYLTHFRQIHCRHTAAAKTIPKIDFKCVKYFGIGQGPLAI